MQSPKLKVGILISSFIVPAWAASALRRIAEGDSAEFALVILAEELPVGNAHGGSHLLYRAFDELDRRLFGRQPDPLAPTSIETLLAGVAQISVSAVRKHDQYGLQDADIQAIQQCHLDLVVKIGLEWLSCDGAGLAAYGTWFYYHGDDRAMTGGPAGFWEVVEGRRETGTALLAEGSQLFGKRVLYRSFFFTYPVSPARHRSYYFWAAASFLPRQIESLRRLGEQKFCQQTEAFNAPFPADRKHYETPAGLAAISPIATVIGRMLKDGFRRLFYLDRWLLLFSLQHGIGDGFRSFERLMPPKGKFWADPQIVQRDGKYYIFIEEFLHSTKKGHIAVIEMDESGQWKAPVKVLERDYHLSYPFVFEWEGQHYMIPESGANRSIDLYESTAFPYEWQFKHSLLQGVRAVDTTLLRHAGKWWLFTAISENEAAAPNVELFLFASDDLLGGQWKPHAQNPIVSDVKRARPAGAIFEQDGKLFRPSQDCTNGYGYGFDLNEIAELSETEYCERPGASVRPDWDKSILATHTYASCGKLTMIDAFSPVRRIG